MIQQFKRKQDTDPALKKKLETLARSRANDPHFHTKEKARRIVNNAVNDGRLTKPSQCPKCKQNKPRHHIHGHHHDYAKPLFIEWVCAKCHHHQHKNKS